MLTLTDFPEFDALTNEWMEWVETEFPRTKERGLQHITSGIDKFTVKEHKEQIWADTLLMTILFMAKMGI
jgi:unsaturated rhamnogalacturonyl hydrolase